MALQQLNLKVPPIVLSDWRRRAREAGHGDSVRDWLLATLSPPAEAAVSPSAAALLSARLDAVETRLAAAVAAAEALASPPAAASPPAPAAADPADPLPSAAVSAALAARGLAIAAGTLNRWAAAHRPGDLWSYRHGGSGQWRLIGKASAVAGAPWLWQPT